MALHVPRPPPQVARHPASRLGRVVQPDDHRDRRARDRIEQVEQPEHQIGQHEVEQEQPRDWVLGDDLVQVIDTGAAEAGLGGLRESDARTLRSMSLLRDLAAWRGALGESLTQLSRFEATGIAETDARHQEREAHLDALESHLAAKSKRTPARAKRRTRRP